MADKKYTLLELHLGDGTIQIGPATLGGTDDGDDDIDGDPLDESGVDTGSESADDETDGGSCLGCTAGKLVAGVLALAVVAAVAKKLLGGGEDLDELEDLADIDEAGEE